MKPPSPTLSVIVPCFNEEEVIEHTHARLCAALTAITSSYEIIYVDDGSRDRTAELLHKIQKTSPRARVLRLSRNFGHQIAVSAGLDYAAGDAVVLIDADLQDPPEVIADMVAKWREGYHVVYGQRADRSGESRFKLWTAHAFYRLINRLSEVPIPLDTGDFRLMDRSVVTALSRMREKHRMLRAMTAWVGFRQIAVPYSRAERFAGTSKYPLRKMIGLALDGIVSFSAIPLKIVTSVGLAFSALSVLGILYAIALRLLTENWVPGWTLIFITLLLIGGLQFIFLGVMGEYIGRIYSEAKDRPLFLVMEELGFDEETKNAVPPARQRRSRKAPATTLR
ncbi:MAG TPA: glycosyltransferase family 2 protein [Allosphingosinicella sp.]|nr:glycosyltransferase family 2 protein [Allosphingosinicella sp.]